jgi:urease accessory protein
MINQLSRLGLALLMTLALGDAASAHHVMGGRTPATFLQGFLSGLGHPIIGIDHLAFIAAIGIVAGVTRITLWAPAVFILMSSIGVGLHVNGIALPAVEPVVAASVLLAGGLIAHGGTLAPSLWLALFAAAGLFHGHAYGESIFGAEPTPLAAYLAGLTLIQTALATAIAVAFRRSRTDVSAVAPRLAGAVVAGIGIATMAARFLPA